MTTQEAVQQVAEESAAAAGLMAALMEQNARDREAALPTWDMLWEAEEKARKRGFTEGYNLARAEVRDRIFGGGGEEL